MKICILGPANRGKEEIWLIDEAKKAFDRVSYVDIPSVVIKSTDKARAVSRNKDLSSFDCILPRIPRTYMHHGYTICRILEKKVFIPYRPENIISVHNKFITLLQLEKSRLPVPKARMAFTRKALERILRKSEYPIVIKLLYGSRGRGVMFTDSYSSAISMIDTIEAIKQPFLVEEYHRKGNEDIRVIVAGDEIIASMKRKAMKGEKRANIGIGGTGKKINLPTDIKYLALRAAKSLGPEILGIDFIETGKGPVIIEANINVQFQGITEATGINVAEKIINYMRHKTEKFIGKKPAD